MAKKLTQAGVEMVAASKIGLGPNLRQGVGSVVTLKKSIADVGLIHPLVVTSDKAFTEKVGKPYLLISGHRRLRAMGLLGMAKVPVRVVDSMDVEDVLGIQLDENEQREDLDAFDASESRYRSVRAELEQQVAPFPKHLQKRALAEIGGAGTANSRNPVIRKAIREAESRAGVTTRGRREDTQIVRAVQRYPELERWGRRPMLAVAEAIDQLPEEERKPMRGLVASYRPSEGTEAAKAIGNLVDKWPPSLRRKLYRKVKSDPEAAQVAALDLPPVPDERMVKLAVVADDLKAIMSQYRRRDVAQHEMQLAAGHIKAAYEALRTAYEVTREEFEETFNG